MSDVAIATTEQPTNRQLARREASKPLKVTGRLKRALDLMVWDCKTDNQAAVETGLTLSALRLALQRPHVRSYYHAQREVLRSRELPRNIHRLIEIRDAANNMPAVQAIKLLEQMPDDESHSTKRAMPGFVVQIVNNAPGVSVVNTPCIQPLDDIALIDNDKPNDDV